MPAGQSNVGRAHAHRPADPAAQAGSIGTLAIAFQAARGSMATVTDGAGGFEVPQPPFQFGDRSVAVGTPVPSLGADTDSTFRTNPRRKR